MPFVGKYARSRYTETNSEVERRLNEELKKEAFERAGGSVQERWDQTVGEGLGGMARGVGHGLGTLVKGVTGHRPGELWSRVSDTMSRAPAEISKEVRRYPQTLRNFGNLLMGQRAAPAARAAAPAPTPKPKAKPAASPGAPSPKPAAPKPAAKPAAPKPRERPEGMKGLGAVGTRSQQAGTSSFYDKMYGR
jgi:hypothetical protein